MRPGRAWAELAPRRVATPAGRAFPSLRGGRSAVSSAGCRRSVLLRESGAAASGAIAEDSTRVPQPSDFPQVNACDQIKAVRISS